MEITKNLKNETEVLAKVNNYFKTLLQGTRDQCVVESPIHADAVDMLLSFGKKSLLCKTPTTNAHTTLTNFCRAAYTYAEKQWQVFGDFISKTCVEVSHC